MFRGVGDERSRRHPRNVARDQPTLLDEILQPGHQEVAMGRIPSDGDGSDIRYEGAHEASPCRRSTDNQNLSIERVDPFLGEGHVVFMWERHQRVRSASASILRARRLHFAKVGLFAPLHACICCEYLLGHLHRALRLVQFHWNRPAIVVSIATMENFHRPTRCLLQLVEIENEVH